ncbi:hypothetical protein Tco_0148872 [Tanacetum coccineum]
MNATCVSLPKDHVRKSAWKLGKAVAKSEGKGQQRFTVLEASPLRRRVLHETWSRCVEVLENKGEREKVLVFW